MLVLDCFPAVFGGSQAQLWSLLAQHVDPRIAAQAQSDAAAEAAIAVAQEGALKKNRPVRKRLQVCDC